MTHRMSPRAAAPRAVAVLAICLTPALAAAAGTFEGRVGDGLSDAEETSSGSMSLTSSDLELVTDGAKLQTVGIRWASVSVPRGASITRAYVQFAAAKRASTGAAALVVRGQAAGAAPPFSTARRNVSSRPRTAASVSWSPPSWTLDAAGADQRVGVTAVVQEIVRRGDWTSGSSLALIITGSGHRNAWAHDGRSAKAPLLHVDYTLTSDTTPPSVALTSPAESATLSDTVTLTAEATDNIGVASVTFEQDSEPLGTDATAPYTYAWDTTQVADGAYSLTAVASDGAGNRAVSTPVVVTVDNTVPPPPPPPPGATRIVPDQFATIQAAIDAAGDGDTVLVRPGTYTGGLLISGKRITLESEYPRTGDPARIENTIVAGGGPILDIAASAVGVVVEGFTFKDGRYAVVASGDRATVRSNRFLDNGADSMSFERTGGTVAGNVFVHSSDDCIDVDGPKVVLIENNICTRAGDDGIEIRNFDYAGPVTLTTVLRGNTIVAAGEDGVQIIDYQATSNRVYRLERNVIRNSIGAGLGIMGNGQTVEDFSGYSMPERVYVLNNTFDGNSYAITGGDNLIALNNIFTSSTVLGLKNVDGKSVAKYSLFYGNAADQQASNVIASEDVTADPLYLDRTGGDLGLRASSPTIDAGTATYVHLGETVLAYPAGSYAGTGPDLGAFETATASAARSAPMPRSARRERQAATR
jgi:hypothetical protein